MIHISSLRRLWQTIVVVTASCLLLLGLVSCVGDGPADTPTDTASGQTEATATEPSATDAGTTPAETESATEPEGTTAEPVPDLTLAPDPPESEPDTSPAEMPRLDINTEGGTGVESKEEYVRATVTLSRCDVQYQFSDVAAGIRVRGNSTAVPAKKPYRLKFDEGQGMLGLNRGRTFKSWCLMADYFDGSMLRTFGTFKFAQTLLNGRAYSADCTHVEVYLNGQYQGVYLLCEQTQIDRYRVNVPEKEDGDTSVEIGYLLIGQGGRTDEPETVVVYPEITVRDRNGGTMHFGALNFALSGSGYTEEQKAYVSAYVSAVFKVVAAAVYENQYYDLARDGTMTPKTEFAWATNERERQIETVSAVFNIDSAVPMCILDEIVKNFDAMTFNMYVDLSPEGDGVLTLAAPWDFDFAMGNARYSTTHSTTGFYATNLTVSDGMRTNLWYVLLGSIDWFDEMVKAEWQTSYSDLRRVVEEMRLVNIRYDGALDRDFERWGKPADRMLIHHDTNDLATFTDHLFAGEFVAAWLDARLTWLNYRWGDPDTIEPLPPAEELLLDFTSPDAMDMLDNFHRCYVDYAGKDGICLAPDENNYDPYFTVNYRNLLEVYTAEDYLCLEITYMVPESCAYDRYDMELFLCSGSVKGATAGISTFVELVADGEWHTVRVDLGATGHWSGNIHSIRMDFFSACEAGDFMFVRNFNLLSAV